MNKGFTIIELLVASLLLGMIVTILTMIFNQSSIAWRTGIAGTVKMDVVRDGIAQVREEADNAFVHNGELYRLTGLWRKDGRSPREFRNRACTAQEMVDRNVMEPKYLKNLNQLNLNNPEMKDMKPFLVGSASADSSDTYIVNVKSAGPDGELNTWDDIWSSPDDFD